MSWRMDSGVSPVHTSVIRVGRLGMSPARMPALAHILRMASSAAALAAWNTISLFVRYQPWSLAVTLPSSPTDTTTPANSSVPWLTTLSWSPGRMPGQVMYLS